MPHGLDQGLGNQDSFKKVGGEGVYGNAPVLWRKKLGGVTIKSNTKEGG